MESFKKEREIIRKHFKKICAEIDLKISDKERSKDDMLSLLRQLEDKGDRLFSSDENIRGMLLSNETEEEDLEEEFNKVEFFREEFVRKRTECEAELKKLLDQTTSQECSGEKNKRKFWLPQIEMKKFDGNVKNWIGFWGQFRKIHEDMEIDSEDKFQYLLQATEVDSAARKLVESFPPSGANYMIAVDQMKARFAKDEFLIEVYVRELLSLVLKQTMDNTSMSLSNLYDKLETQLRALESLGVTKEKYAAMLYPLVESSLPNDTLKAWERYRSSNEVNNISNPNEIGKSICGSDNLSFLLDFLRSEVESEKRINLAQSSFYNEAVDKTGDGGLYTAAALYSASSKDAGKVGKKVPYCLFCTKSHWSQDCLKAQKLSLNERKNIVKEKKGLKQYHSCKQCRAFVRCIVCSRKHYPIMCPDLDVKKGKKDTEKNEIENILTSNLSNTVLLQTVLVRIHFEGSEKIVRALLDSGSQRSYILSRSAEELKLRKIDNETIIQGVFGGKQSQPETHKLFEVTIKSIDNTHEFKINMLNQDKICNYIPRINDSSCINYLKQSNIVIHDSNLSNAPKEIELLLGADIFGHLLTGRKHHLDGGLVAFETYLGWTLIGQYDTKQRNETIFSGFSELSIPDSWELELLGIKDSVQVKSNEILEEQALIHFYDTITINDEKRYEIKLPWSQDHLNILDNKEMALSRLESNTKRLLSLKKYDDYSRVFDEWEELGIIEEVTDEKEMRQENSIHYLSHHAVIKESSATTKIRPVFDASARDKDGNSLNDRDREDRDYLRFFWWRNYSEKEIKIYKHCRVVFGVKCSSFILSATISYHLDNVAVQLKKTAEKLKNSFYVDNSVTSVTNESECAKFIEEATFIMSSAKFNLRGWIYNSQKSKEISDQVNVVGVLRLLWNIQEDTLFCDIHSMSDSQIVLTKRSLLSVAQKIFDSIDFLCPVLLIPKLLLQETWQVKIGWDQELPSEISKKFQCWAKQVDLFVHCKIPRTLCGNSNLENSSNSTIHVFCDASKSAYASCIFLRTIINGVISVNIILAKSRLAPKNITLPRLELLAALLGVRLYITVTKIKEFCDMKTYFWSDSMVTLTWIRTKGQWKTFVENRVKDIRLHTNTDDWYHVPGKINPADLASRGCNARTLLETKWWFGPTWLKNNSEEWPNNEIFCPEEVNSEKRNTTQVLISKVNKTTEEFQYFSKYSKVLRMIAWMLRFGFNSKRRNLKKSGEITCDEVSEAEKRLLRMVQEEVFGKDLSSLNLETFQDENKLWRIRSRLILGDFEENFKYPILLPSKHVLVNRLIEEYHILNRHTGVQTLLSILREKFWILKGRKTVRQVISKCCLCKRYTSKPIETPFAPLPRNRITCGKAFNVVGIDLAGPLYLKDKTKTWIVLFTCAVYRAIHLELAHPRPRTGYRCSSLFDCTGSSNNGASAEKKEICTPEEKSYNPTDQSEMEVDSARAPTELMSPVALPESKDTGGHERGAEKGELSGVPHHTKH
ncbi:uncharacterized protein LOC123315444 [Coccinella septempunctata]|uniref:uncharacterized protein LOC123315444 n=1 Tax=Coccinella septempunctata TaxID=41139 RepID=UPI001D091B7A|nr:uncharacterized protein LOC123315444 [Coccinella septempunctata]